MKVGDDMSVIIPDETRTGALWHVDTTAKEIAPACDGADVHNRGTRVLEEIKQVTILILNYSRMVLQRILIVMVYDKIPVTLLRPSKMQEKFGNKLH